MILKRMKNRDLKTGNNSKAIINKRITNSNKGLNRLLSNSSIAVILRMLLSQDLTTVPTIEATIKAVIKDHLNKTAIIKTEADITDLLSRVDIIRIEAGIKDHSRADTIVLRNKAGITKIEGGIIDLRNKMVIIKAGTIVHLNRVDTIKIEAGIIDLRREDTTDHHSREGITDLRNKADTTIDLKAAAIVSTLTDDRLRIATNRF